MSIHIGILGGGNISQTHANAAREIDGVNIAAVCGPNHEKLARLANLTGAAAYHAVDSFLNHTPMDVVLIGSPSGLHAEHGIASAHRGLHVLVEKPLDVTTERVDELIDACEKARVKLGVFYQERVAPDIATLKRAIDSGELGKPILISASVRWYRPTGYYKDSPWRGSRELAGGGALIGQGIHTIDLLLWLFGDVRTVWARAIAALHDIEVEDTMVASFEFANGAIGNFEAATAAYPGFARRIEMTWSQGTVIVENERISSVSLRTPVDGLSVTQRSGESERSVSPVISDTRGHRAIIEDFLKAIAADRPPLCDGYQARRSVQLVQAMYQSARSGEAFSISGVETQSRKSRA